MRITTTFALVLATLALAVPIAAADPDTYPAAPTAAAPSDAVDRYVGNASRSGGEPDALARYLRGHRDDAATGAATHLDSHDFRPTTSGSPAPVADEGRDWTQGVLVVLGACLVALLAVVGASAARERRRPVLH